ncbi:MAG TPA: polyprenyl diphosphate synthase [Patescibacteria group bacterium]|nr:polyprenyl diphosphate synthase [Patescibacteria group bacterium]
MTEIPHHIAIIMDGNRRWAEERGLSIKKGHDEGAKNLRRIALRAFEKGVKHFSVYAFSTENWQRKSDEVKHLMGLVIRSFEKYFEEFNQKGIRVVVLGSKENVDKKVLAAFANAETKTKNNISGTFIICFNYGGRREIVDATKRMVADKIKPNEVTEAKFAEYLYAPDIPPVDILVRTSGEQRISNFMLWRIAYSEIYFIDKHWPDFNYNDLDDVIAAYSKRQRRYGK